MLHFTFVTIILCRQWRALMFCFNSCDSDVNSCSSGRQAVWCSFYSTISPVTNTCKLTSISLWDSKEWYLLNYVKNLKNLHLSFREWKEIKTTMNISSTTKIKAVTKVAPPPWIPAISIISVQAKTTPTAAKKTVQMQRLLSARAVMENCVLLSQSPAVVHNSVAGFVNIDIKICFPILQVRCSVVDKNPAMWFKDLSKARVPRQHLSHSPAQVEDLILIGSFWIQTIFSASEQYVRGKLCHLCLKRLFT